MSVARDLGGGQFTDGARAHLIEVAMTLRSRSAAPSPADADVVPSVVFVGQQRIRSKSGGTIGSAFDVLAQDDAPTQEDALTPGDMFTRDDAFTRDGVFTLDDVVVPATAPLLPRLFLAPTSVDAPLQGGWWPHSYDPLAELPGLVLALCARFGSIREVSLHSNDWHWPFRRLAVGAGVVDLEWSSALDPAIMVAMTGADKALSLLVVAPQTDAETAKWAMTMAADPVNTLSAQDILAAAMLLPSRGIKR
jgi:hypothetical protein